MLGSLKINALGLEGASGRVENRKLSASRPAMSSQELITSGSDLMGLGSETGLGKTEPRVNRAAGVGGWVGWGGGSRLSRP